MTKLLITGMFRSGTTFLARALNSHPEMIVASDPFFRFYRAGRNLSFQGTGFDMSLPMEDYFCNPDNMERVEKKFPNVEFSEADIVDLRKNISDHTLMFSPKVIDFLDELKPANAINVWMQLYSILEKAYPKNDAKVVGAKEVWTDEFASILLDQIDSSFKVIHIIRDPRAVLASNRKHETGPYPILFMARQWRKSFAFRQKIKENPNVFLLKYEDLILEPERIFEEICTFLNVNFDPILLNPSGFKDGNNQPWKQNSSHGSSKEFNKSFMDKWKNILTDEEKQIMEGLCQFEMSELGYQFENKDLSNLWKILANYDESKMQFKAYGELFTINEKEIEDEIIRNILVKDTTKIFPDFILKKYFLFSESYFNLKKSEFKLSHNKRSLPIES